MATVDLKIRVLVSDAECIREAASASGISHAAYLRRQLGLAEPPTRGGPGRGQGRKRKALDSIAAKR